MNTDEKLKAIADVVTQAVKDSGGKFGNDTFTIKEIDETTDDKDE
jgi:hypothetical protein